MEHFALLQPAAILPAPPGTRLIFVRTVEQGTAWAVEHEVLCVVGIQPITAQHYSKETVSPVFPTPELMEKHGWGFDRLELRYAPIFVTREGRVATVAADDPCWQLVPPGTSDERIETLAAALKAKEGERQVIERRIEEREDGALEGD